MLERFRVAVGLALGEFHGLLRPLDGRLHVARFGVGRRQGAEDVGRLVVGQLAGLGGDLDCPLGVAEPVGGRGAQNPGQVVERAGVVGHELGGFFQVGDRLGVLADRKVGVSAEPQRGGVVRIAFQHFIVILDRLGIVLLAGVESSQLEDHGEVLGEGLFEFLQFLDRRGEIAPIGQQHGPELHHAALHFILHVGVQLEGPVDVGKGGFVIAQFLLDAGSQQQRGDLARLELISLVERFQSRLELGFHGIDLPHLNPRLGRFGGQLGSFLEQVERFIEERFLLFLGLFGRRIELHGLLHQDHAQREQRDRLFRLQLGGFPQVGLGLVQPVGVGVHGPAHAERIGRLGIGLDGLVKQGELCLVVLLDRGFQDQPPGLGGRVVLAQFDRLVEGGAGALGVALGKQVQPRDHDQGFDLVRVQFQRPLQIAERHHPVLGPHRAGRNLPEDLFADKNPSPDSR